MQDITLIEAADVQAMIDAAVAPLVARLDKLDPQYPSGIPITTDMPAGWREVINEQFRTDCTETEFPALYGPRIKLYPSNYPDTSRRGFYGNYVSVQGNVLRARCFVDAGGIPRCSSVIPRATDVDTWGSSAGLMWEERSRFTISGVGFKFAHLAWPASNHSTNWVDAAGVAHRGDGELDWPEFDTGQSGAAGFVHYEGAVVGSDQLPINTSIDIAQWHTYRTTWIPGKSVRFECDGKVIAETTTRVPKNPMRLSLQNETSLRRDVNKVLVPIDPKATLLCETDWYRVLVPAA